MHDTRSSSRRQASFESTARQYQTWRLFAAGVVVSLGILTIGSLAPFEFQDISFADWNARFAEVLRTPLDFSSGKMDFAINVCVTIPLAFSGLGLARLAWIPNNPTARRVWKTASLPLIVAATLLSGVCVEYLQVAIDSRNSSARDLVAQLVGSGAGIAAYIVFGKRVVEWANSIHQDQATTERLAWALRAYLVGLILYSVFPLDVISSPADLFGKFKNNRIELEPFSHSYPNLLTAINAYASDFLRFVPVGVLAAIGFRRHHGQSRSLIEQACISALIVVAIEAMQLPFASRFTSITDIILGIGGCLLGIGLTRVFINDRSATDASSGRRMSGHDAFTRMSPWLLSAIAYVLLLTFVFWAPFEFSSDAELIRERLRDFVPRSFRVLVAGTHVNTAYAFFHAAIWFLAFGGLVGGSLLSPHTLFTLSRCFDRRMPPINRYRCHRNRARACAAAQQSCDTC